MPESRRARPTIRCLVDDLGIDLPDLGVELDDMEHQLLDELRRVAPESPKGQKRILSIDDPLVYRIRISSDRGATWVEERKIEGVERAIVWLCAVHRREADSDNDAFDYFRDLHASGELLPDDDDLLRDKAEAVVRLYKGLRSELIALLDDAVSASGIEQAVELGDWLPCRILVREDEDVEEIWCALSSRGSDGSFVAENLRDLLFVALEEHVAPAVFETRNDWPTGAVEWFEFVRLGLR